MSAFRVVGHDKENGGGFYDIESINVHISNPFEGKQFETEKQADEYLRKNLRKDIFLGQDIELVKQLNREQVLFCETAEKGAFCWAIDERDKKPYAFGATNVGNLFDMAVVEHNDPHGGSIYFLEEDYKETTMYGL